MRLRAGRRGHLPRSPAARVGGVAVAMLIVAEGAVWLLSPREALPAPLPVAGSDLLPPGALERATDFRDGQRWLGLASIGAQAALLGLAALGRPTAARARLRALGASRPLAAAGLVGAGLALALAAASLAFRLLAHERAVDAGVSVQSLGSWAWDLLRSTAITAGLAAGAVALLYALVRRFPRAWWAPASAAALVLAVAFVWIAPLLLAPLFNRFTPLPDSALRADVIELGRRAGVEIGEVASVDASRRATSLNAYVDGIGPTKRVVLYDTLIADAERPELSSVIAHELSHVEGADIPRGLAYVALVAPLGFLFARELGSALAQRAGIAPGEPAALPAYLFALALASFALGVPGNQLSRAVEARADAFALELTKDPQALIDLQLRLVRENLSDPDPPALATALLATHPPAVERVGAALAYARERGLAARVPAPVAVRNE